MSTTAPPTAAEIAAQEAEAAQRLRAELDAQTDEEPEPDDASDGGSQEPPEPPAPPAEGDDGQTEAFDRSQYDREDLQIAKVDGETIDRIAVKFAGEIFLDRSEPSDVAVYNELRLGRDVNLYIEAKVTSTRASGATNRDGELDVVVGQKTLKVHTLSKPAGAEWVEDGAES